MAERRARLALRATAVLAAFLALLPAPSSRAAQKVLGTGGANTAYAGQRNLIFIPGKGYWAFFKATNSDRVVYRYSPDGITWKAKDEYGNWVAQADVFPYLQTAPDAAWPAASVWYAPDLNRVYVIANDGTIDIGGGGSTVNGTKTDGTGNKLFIRWGTLSSDGAIAWDATSGIRRQRMTLRLNTPTNCQETTNNRNQTFDPRAQRSSVIAYSSNTTGGKYLAVFADTNNNRVGTGGYEGAGTIGITNLTLDATGYWGGVADPNVWAYCHYIGNTGTDQDASLDLLAGPAIAPVLDGANPRWVLGTRTDNIDDTNNRDGAIITLDTGPQPTGGTLSQTATDLDLSSLVHNVTTSGDQEGYGMSAINELGTSIAHFVWIDRNGRVRYQRRTSAGATTPAAGIILDTAGTQLQPSADPAISLSYKSATTDTYMIWVSTNQDELRYRACRNNAADTAGCDAMVTWRTGNSFNNPKLGFWGGLNEPMPVLYSDVNSVYFDEIITSTFAIPTVTSVSTLPAAAYLTAPTYELNITGTNFEALPGGKIPSFYILQSSAAQNDIEVGSVTWVSKTNMRAVITLSTHVLTDFDFDLRVRMPDGQEYPSRYDRNRGNTVDKPLTLRLNAPNITSLTDDDGGAFVSGGTVRQSDGTTNESRALTIVGSDFMNWTGQNGSILPSSYTASIQFLNSATGALEPNISVASMVYTGSTKLTAYLIISTAAAPAQYQILLVNPSSGSALSAASTFYVTVPTATITTPPPGNNLGFTVVAGTVGFNNYGQTTISGAQVRITHLDSGKIWNGTVMTNIGFPTEEAKWRNATLSAGATAYSYIFNTGDTVNIPEDGPYQIAVRSRTGDRGIGDPYQPGFISTRTVNLDRFPPSVILELPVAGATNTVTNVITQFSDLGSGVTTTQMLIQDVGIPTVGTETWRAFDENGALGAPGVQIWLSTDVGTPQTIFVPGVVGGTSVDLNAASTIMLPTWQDGHKYRVSAYVNDAAGRSVDLSSSGTSGYTTFVYDVTRPTVTISAPVGLALSSGAATWVTSFTDIGGAIKDNVSDSLDQQHVYVRVAELFPGSAEVVNRWLRPSDLTFTNSIAPDQAYKEIVKTMTAPDASDPWTWDISAAQGQLTDGLVYRIDIYATDSAGNSTGTATSPTIQRYLRLDRTPPVISQVIMSTGGVDNASVYFGTTPTVGLYESTSPLTSIRLHLNDGTGSGIASARYYLRFDGASGFYQYDPPLIYWQTATTTSAYKVALTTSVPWLNSQNYYLYYEIYDVAGNQAAYSWNFTYDTSSPTLSGFSISSGTTYSDSLDLPNAIAGIAVDQLNQIGKVNAGVFQVGVGVRRQSDGLWFRTLAPNWNATRADPLITSFSGNNWSLTPLGDQNGSFWNTSSTDTYYVYVWAQDNVVSTFTNVNSSQTLATVFQWEVQAPSSTFILPDAATNNVWYSSVAGYNLPLIVGTAFDQPAGGPGAGSNQTCASPVLGHTPAELRPGARHGCELQYAGRSRRVAGRFAQHLRRGGGGPGHLERSVLEWHRFHSHLRRGQRLSHHDRQQLQLHLRHADRRRRRSVGEPGQRQHLPRAAARQGRGRDLGRRLATEHRGPSRARGLRQPAAGQIQRALLPRRQAGSRHFHHQPRPCLQHQLAGRHHQRLGLRPALGAGQDLPGGLHGFRGHAELQQLFERLDRRRLL